jgi:hypothetical protein
LIKRAGNGKYERAFSQELLYIRTFKVFASDMKIKALLILLITQIFLCLYYYSPGQSFLDNLPSGPYGGGRGYKGLVVDLLSYDIAGNYNELVNLLADATVNKIYIADGANIELTKDQYIIIDGRSDLIIAGGRGVPGITPGRIVRDIEPGDGEKVVFKIFNSSNIRITGLVIEGPYGLKDTSDVSANAISGIWIRNSSNTEIDNCYIKNWTNSGVNVRGAGSTHAVAIIHHNVFEHNNADDWGSGGTTLGYGVSITENGEALMAYNIFSNNKHAIAGSSHGKESYTASHNIVNPNQERNDHSFDMHGYYDRYGWPNENCPDPKSPCNYAGVKIKINNNFFEQNYSIQEAIQIRGIPKDTAIISDNYFRSGVDFTIFQQWHSGNWDYDHDNFIGIGVSNSSVNQTIRYINSSYSGLTDWKLVGPFVWDQNEIGTGDFDGDGADDLFRSQDGKWFVSKRAGGRWEHWGNSAFPASELIFADFTNDGKADLLRTSSSGDCQMQNQAGMDSLLGPMLGH